MKQPLFSLQRSGFTLTQLLITVLVAGAVIGGFFYLLNFERAKTRDAKRVADMTRVQSAFEYLYLTSASYRSAAENGGCSTVGAAVSTCIFPTPYADLSNVKDPAGLGYAVSKVPNDEGWEVTFQLERSYGDLTSGVHTVSPEGLK